MKKYIFIFIFAMFFTGCGLQYGEEKNFEDQGETLETLEDTDHFSDSAIEHIFEGEINGRGKAVGYHYEGIEGASGRTVAGTKSEEDSHGVYKARVEVEGIRKSANGGYSTFFPEDKSPQEVVDDINEAYVNRIHIQGNTYIGMSSEGIEIQMYINEEGEILSAFPLMKSTGILRGDGR